jgi:hypothetical protein
MRRNLSIFISVKLPITPHNVRYKVFKILAFPVPVNESSPHATQFSISFGGMSKGDIFPVNNNAIDDNNFPRNRSILLIM